MNNYDTSNQTIILVNEKDEQIGTMQKMEAHEKGLLHRAFSVMLYRHNEKGELEVLMQKRHRAKYHCGGLWTNTCCGHPSPNESVHEAATRRLFEETHIKAELSPKGSFRYIAQFGNGLTEHELDHVFIAEYQENPQDFNRQEISEMKWISTKALKKHFDENPHLYTPWLNQVMNHLTL